MADRTRKDALRNRARIIDAAMVEVAAHGVDVLSERIAERAGVGIATLYRHFPKRDLLLAAVYRRAFDDTDALAVEALAIEDPWEALLHYYDRIGRWAEATPILPALTAALMRVPVPRDHAFFGHWGELVERIRAAGAIRADATSADLEFVTFSVVLVLGQTQARAPGFWRRHLQLCLDGLRAPGGTLPDLDLPGSVEESLAANPRP